MWILSVILKADARLLYCDTAVATIARVIVMTGVSSASQGLFAACQNADPGTPPSVTTVGQIRSCKCSERLVLTE